MIISRKTSSFSTVELPSIIASLITFWQICLMSAPVVPSARMAKSPMSASECVYSARNSENRRFLQRMPGSPNSSLQVKRRQTAGASRWSWFVAASSTVSSPRASIFCNRLTTTRFSSPSSCWSSRSFATESNSSKKRMHGRFRTCSKSSRMFFASNPD